MYNISLPCKIKDSLGINLPLSQDERLSHDKETAANEPFERAPLLLHTHSPHIPGQGTEQKPAARERRTCLLVSFFQSSFFSLFAVPQHHLPKS